MVSCFPSQESRPNPVMCVPLCSGIWGLVALHLHASGRDHPRSCQHHVQWSQTHTRNPSRIREAHVCLCIYVYIYILICIYIAAYGSTIYRQDLAGDVYSKVQDLLDTAVHYRTVQLYTLLHPHYPHYMYITITIRSQLQLHRYYNYNFSTLHTQVCDMCVCVFAGLSVCWRIYMNAEGWNIC